MHVVQMRLGPVFLQTKFFQLFRTIVFVFVGLVPVTTDAFNVQHSFKRLNTIFKGP